MPASTATAPGKIILFGEHAVVYGRPAIAVPVNQVRARATVMPEIRGEPGSISIQAQDIGLDASLDALSPGHPLALAVRGVLETLNCQSPPAFRLRISSTIPVAAGLGSGAAVSVAIIRALSDFLGQPLPDDRVCALAYEVEKIYHGTPSGIDNTVITYNHPVYFVRGQVVETFQVKKPFTMVIGDTGISSPTSIAVGDVRRLWQELPEKFESLFDQVGTIVQSARQVIESGQVEQLGPLMDHNHVLLQEIGVSSVELDRLVDAAHTAGALGAKLSGGGRGGNMIAMTTPQTASTVADALNLAGATRTLVFTVE